MSLWGNSDNLTIPGAPTSVTIVGSASSEFWTAVGGGVTLVPSGTTMILGTLPGDAGMAVVEAPLVDEAGQLVPNTVKINILSAVPGSHDVVYAQQPIQISHDPGFNGWSNPDGVTVSGAAVEQNPDFAEIGRTQMAVGVGTTTMGVLQPGVAGEPEIKFHLDHSGWVGVMTYMSFDPETGISTMRVKKEVYVAMSGIDTGNRPYPEVFGV